MEIQKKIVQSYSEPENTHVIWLDSNDNKLKTYKNGSWQSLIKGNDIEYIDFKKYFAFGADNGIITLEQLKSAGNYDLFESLLKVREQFIQNKSAYIAYMTPFQSSGPNSYCYSSIDYIRGFANDDKYNNGELEDMNANNIPDYITIEGNAFLAPFGFQFTSPLMGIIQIMCKYSVDYNDYIISIFGFQQ